MSNYYYERLQSGAIADLQRNQSGMRAEKERVNKRWSTFFLRLNDKQKYVSKCILL